MLIQDRDEAILRCCYEQQFLTMDHLGRFFYAGKHKGEPYRRIQELERAGLIRKERHPLLGGRSLIRLTQKGTEVALKDCPIKVAQLKRLDFRTLTHDALVTSVRLRIESLWDGRWVPERAIKQEEYPQIPDGVFCFESGRKVAFEVEHSLKGRERFLDRTASWRREPVFFVLYVATTAAIHSSLRRFLNDAPPDLALGLVSWTDLETTTPPVWTPRGEFNLFTKRTY